MFHLLLKKWPLDDFYILSDKHLRQMMPLVRRQQPLASRSPKISPSVLFSTQRDPPWEMPIVYALRSGRGGGHFEVGGRKYLGGGDKEGALEL